MQNAPFPLMSFKPTIARLRSLLGCRMLPNAPLDLFLTYQEFAEIDILTKFWGRLPGTSNGVPENLFLKV